MRQASRVTLGHNGVIYWGTLYTWQPRVTRAERPAVNSGVNSFKHMEEALISNHLRGGGHQRDVEVEEECNPLHLRRKRGRLKVAKVGQGRLGQVSTASTLRSNAKRATRAIEALMLRLSAERRAAAAVNTTVTTT